MDKFLLPFVLTFLLGCAALAQVAESGAESYVREPRGILARRRCKKYGICEGYGGHPGGGYGGYGGYQGGYEGGYHGGYQGGYGGLPPINIGISQSQSSANAGGGAVGHGVFPNNYQFNNGFGGYPHVAQGGFPHGGYFGNGQGAYNTQFNGNYYGGQSNSRPGFGGFAFQGPFGNGFLADEGQSGDHGPLHDNPQNDVEHDQGPQNDYGPNNYAASGSFAFAGRKNK